MGKVNALTHRFNAGEVSQAALARIDQERLRVAAEIQENVIPLVIGKGQIRGGTEYIGASASNAQARYLPFVKSVDDTALLELTNGKLRVWVNDALVTRGSVSTSITSGDFSSSTGWTLTSTGGGSATVTGGYLKLNGTASGGVAIAKQTVAIGTANTEHGVTIVVLRGPVSFAIGSADNLDDYVTETTLDEGTHKIAFTPTTGNLYVQFRAEGIVDRRVDSVTIDAAGVIEFTAPWVTADLDDIQYDQSGDIVFMAHEDWQQRKIERRGTNSWSLVKYYATGGPFTTGRTRNVKLTPAALNGNTTLTADRAFFKSTHVGALFYLFHENQRTSNIVGSDGSFSDTIRVNGVGSDRLFAHTISGTFVGTVTLQRSYDGADTGFIDVTSYTTTHTSTNLTDTLDNEVIYYRMGFKSGEYTSGSATVTMYFQGGGGRGLCRVTDIVSSTVANVEVLEPFKDLTATDNWREGEWSDKRGWPSAVSFHDGRLWWGGRDKFWGSVSDDYYSFDTEVEGDSASIQRSVATGGSYNKVQWMLSLQRLMIGTPNAVASVRSSAIDEPLTPTNVTLKECTTQGVSTVRPVKVDSRACFIQRAGTRLYQLAFNFDAADYSAQSLVKLNENIGGDGISRIAVQRQPDTYIWGRRADGQAVVHLWEPQSEEVSCWVRFISDGASGEIEDIIVLPSTIQDRVYFSIKRTINGSTARYLEKLALNSEAIGSTTNKMADAFKFVSGPASSVTAAHLASQTGLVGWGTNNSGTKVALTGLSANSSGVISLGATYTNVCVGLPYDWRYKSAKLAYAAEGGTALLQKKRVGQLGLLLENTHRDAVSYGANFDTMRKIPRTSRGTAIGDTVMDIFDDMSFPFPGDWDTDSRVCLAGSAPYPCTLLAMVIGVETNEK